VQLLHCSTNKVRHCKPHKHKGQHVHFKIQAQKCKPVQKVLPDAEQQLLNMWSPQPCGPYMFCGSYAQYARHAT
jgi:hypothetical protein